MPGRSAKTAKVCSLCGTRRRPVECPRCSSPSRAKAKADRLFSQLVRLEVGVCENCGATPDQAQLQCAHVISRRYSWTRTYRPNAKALCAGCHHYMGAHPHEWYRFVAASDPAGEAIWDHLYERSNRRDAFDWFAEVERLKAELALLEKVRG